MKISFPLFNLVLILSILSGHLYAVVNLTGTWEGTYLNNHMHSGSVTCSAYQVNDLIYGSVTDNGNNATYYGTFSKDYDSLDVTMISEEGTFIYVKCLVYTDSVAFTYASADSSYYGAGHVLKTGPSRTLIVNFNYTGENETSSIRPIGIELFDNPDVLSSSSTNRLTLTENSGKAYFTGITSDTVYCLIYTWVSDSIQFYNSFQCSYSVYGNPETMECDTIVIAPGAEEEITLNFDDTYLYPIDAAFPGGKLINEMPVSLPFKPKSITADPLGKICIIDNNSNVLRYNENIILQDTLKADDNSVINASLLKYAPDSSFYIFSVNEIIHYSKSHHLSGSVVTGADWADMAIDNNGNVFFASSSSIIRYNADLSAQTATLDLATIKSNYPAIDTDCQIRSIAVKSNNMISIGIDAEPDEDGKDVVLIYNNDLTQIENTIWEEWLFNNPLNMDFDDENNLFVLNYWNDILIVFDSTGKRSQSSYWADKPGTENGAMHGPRDLTILNNKIYVIEDENNRVSIFTLNCPSYVKFDEAKTICSGSTYNWHGLELSQTGIYYDSLTTTEGCDSIYQISLVVKPTPQKPAVSNDNGNLSSDAALGNQWYNLEEGKLNGATSQVFPTINEGQYYVIVTLDGCSSEPSDTIEVSYDGIKDISESISINLFPNPANESINLTASSETLIQSIILKDISGKQILLTKINPTDSYTLNIASLTPVLYTVQIITSKGLVSRTFIKNKN